MILGATGFELPSTGLVFAPARSSSASVVGTLIALFASLRPAMRATRIQPIAAVREGAVLPPGRFARIGHPPGESPCSSRGSGCSSTARRRAGSRPPRLHRVPRARRPAVPQGRLDDRAAADPAARVGARRTGRAPRRLGGLARPAERDAQPVPDRLDRRRADDRALADHVRRRARPGRRRARSGRPSTSCSSPTTR